MNSLRAKVTAIIVAAIVASLVAASVAGYVTVGKEVGTSSAEKMHLLSENAQKSMDSYLNGVKQSVELMSYIATSRFDAVQLVERGANKAPAERTAEQTQLLNAYLKDNIPQLQDSFGNVANYTNGVVSYYFCVSPELSATEHGFYYSRMGKVGFESNPPLDATKLDPSDLEHNIWYFSTVELGVPTWVGPYRAEDLNDAIVISYITPIYKSGVLLGLMGMDILFNTLIEQIDSLEVYQTGFACLMDEAGNVIYHPDYGTQLEATAGLSLFGDEALSGQSSKTKAVYYNKDGARWQMSYSTLSNGMKLVVTAPVSEIIASWINLLAAVPFLGTVILVIFVGIALVVAGAVTRPLKQLTEAANQLSSGEYDIELNYRANDEVGKLTDAFRRLRDHLQVYTSNLNSDSFSDELTGVKNARAFEMYAAQTNDAIGHSPDHEDVRFALVVFECLDTSRLSSDFGESYADLGVQTLCKLICQVYSRAAVFRVGESRFVAYLQGRNYANRDELLCDFDILADDLNVRATEPWFQVHAAKGMATYRSQEDKGVASVLERAMRRMEQA